MKNPKGDVTTEKKIIVKHIHLHIKSHAILTVQADAVSSQLGDFPDFSLIVPRHVHQGPPKVMKKPYHTLYQH
jgi:hypothetical protein